MKKDYEISNGWAQLLVRFLALIWLSVGVFWFVSNVVETIPEFNPAHWAYYLKISLLRPLLALLIGLFLWWRSHSLARCLTRNSSG